MQPRERYEYAWLEGGILYLCTLEGKQEIDNVYDAIDGKHLEEDDIYFAYKAYLGDEGWKQVQETDDGELLLVRTK